MRRHLSSLWLALAGHLLRACIAALLLAMLLSLSGCATTLTPSDTLDAASQVRALLCGGAEALETQLRTYIEAAEAKEEMIEEGEEPPAEGPVESFRRPSEEAEQ